MGRLVLCIIQNMFTNLSNSLAPYSLNVPLAFLIPKVNRVVIRQPFRSHGILNESFLKTNESPI